MELENNWEPIEDEIALENYSVLNSIYNRVDKNIFGIINTPTSAKDAWETLEVAHEGTFKVGCQDFNSSPPNLRTCRCLRIKSFMGLIITKF